MMRTSLEHFNCSLARTIDVVGDKWTLLIIRDAFYGISSFSEFKARLGMTQTVLSDRLQKLVDHGILDRVQTRPDVERYAYKLSPSGRDLFPAIVSLVQWGDKWIFGADREPINIMDKRHNAPVQDMAVQARDGQFLQSRDVIYAPGPGASAETLAAFKELESV